MNNETEEDSSWVKPLEEVIYDYLADTNITAGQYLSFLIVCVTNIVEVNNLSEDEYVNILGRMLENFREKRKVRRDLDRQYTASLETQNKMWDEITNDPNNCSPEYLS